MLLWDPRPKVAMSDGTGPGHKPSPEDLIAAIAARQDRDAFKQLFEFYAPRIKTMLMRAGAAGEIAEEIAQETLVTVWRKAGSYDRTRAGAAAWIYTIARNRRIDRLRQDQRAKLHAVYDLAEPDKAEPADAPLDAMQRDRRVRAEMEKLPKDQLRVIELSFFEGLVHSEIASKLGIPLGTVKSRLRLAMARMREALGDTL